MNTENLILIELVFGAIVVFGFGFYQLWSLRRETKRDEEQAEPGSTGGVGSGPAPGSGHPVGEHELDDR